MRRRVIFNYIILLMFCLVGGGFLGSNLVFADVNDFYFEDFTGDYYLSRDEEGVSRLKVIESVTAVFPNYPQNKGICRQIPFTNQDGKNVTLPSLTRENLVLKRNGKNEPIYSITKENSYYNVCTGTEEYVLGEQVYEFSYEFMKVVTDFGNFQELYWDTNGNGALQKFEKVTARLHFEDPSIFSGKSWCYVGKYGESDQGRCEISEIEDGVQFEATDLERNENLTFDVEIKPESFVVPMPEERYVYVYLLAVLGIGGLIICGLYLRKFFKTRDKANYYKGLFVKPEYQPNAKYSLAEMAEIYLGKKHDYKVGMLLEMIVRKEIELKKNEEKWAIIVKKEPLAEYGDLLSILNNGTRVRVGDEILIEQHKASNRLVTLRRAMESKILGDLKRDGLVENKYVIGSSNKRGVFGNIILALLISIFLYVIFYFVMAVISPILELDGYGKIYVFYEYYYPVSFVMIFLFTFICVLLDVYSKKYESHTLEGLKMSRYMDGLKLYIEMAEADRMKMLQSVEGADISNKKIVKLYEKLLPYAAVFGLEESWMKEMKKYCEINEIEEPDYLLTGVALSEISRNIRVASTVMNNSTVMASSGGSSSSGFSGGGGGGFSGGGGGGGGFSGR